MIGIHRAVAAPLIACMVVLLASDLLADAASWDRPRLNISDYSTNLWDGVFLETTADMRSILSGRGPKLRYRRFAPRPCRDLPERPGEILICSEVGEHKDAHAALWYSGNEIVRAEIRLDPDEDFLIDEGTPLRLEALALHEMTHAILDSNERVAGDSPEPTKAMRKNAQKTYGGTDRKHGKHKRHR